MSTNMLDRITHQVRNLIPWKRDTSAPTPVQRISKLNDNKINDEENNVNVVHGQHLYVEKKPYKRSDPIDIIYPKATW